MHRHRPTTAALAAALVVSLGALAGCSPTQSPSACLGDWTITDMQVGDETVGEEELATLDSMGLQIRLSVLEGGDAELIFLGDVEQGTWVDRPGGCLLTFSGDDLPATVADDELTMTQGDQSVSFARADSPS